MGIKEELQEAGIALLNEDEKKEIVALFNAKLAAMGGGGRRLSRPSRTLTMSKRAQDPNAGAACR